MYASGSTISDIIQQLASAGIQTIKGQSVWSKNNIKRMLRNIKYTGNSKIVKQASRLSELQINPLKEDEEILIHNSHPAIIDQTLFDAVQMKINANHTSRTFIPPGKENILVGRIHCAHCGANYVLFKRINKDTVHVCATRRKNKDSCSSSFFKASQVIQLMKQVIGDSYTMEEPSKIEHLRSDLIVSCKLDQFEKERLDRVITIARLTQQIQMTSNHTHLIDEKNALEHSFHEFEQDLESAENDLAIRMKLINKLSKTHSLESFFEVFTVEDSCALFPSIKLYSNKDAILTWHNHHKTIIGHCPSSTISIPSSFPETKEINNTDTFSKVVIPWNKKAVIAQSKLHTGQLLSSMKTSSGLKLRVCAYCRTSAAEEQHISSLSRQVASYTYVIMTNPAYTFAGVYADHGKSGLNITKRSGFQQMIDDARSGQFDLIITKSVSRFGRNVVDVLATVRELKSLPKPVLVLFENESLRSDLPQCDFMLSLHATLAQNEAYSSSESIRWSHIKSLKNGSYNQTGKLPYGYFKTSNNHWMINETEASVIRCIFDAYINGKTPYTIASDLTYDQILNTRGGKQWRPATIYRMIHNITYIGHFLHGRLFRPNLTSTKRITNQGHVDQYLIEHHHPPIIDLDAWNQAQAISNSRKRAMFNRKKQKDDYVIDIHRQTLIKQRVRCGKCRKAMFYRSIPYKQRSYPYWKCITSIKSIQYDRCDLKAIRQEIIEHAIMICLLRMKHNDDWQSSARLYCDQTKQNNDMDASLEQLKSHETHIYTQIYACIKTEQEQSTHMIDPITSYTEQLLATKSQINELEHNKKATEAEILYLSNLTHILSNIQDFDPETERIELRDDIFEKLFKSVEIFAYVA